MRINEGNDEVKGLIRQINALKTFLRSKGYDIEYINTLIENGSLMEEFQWKKNEIIVKLDELGLIVENINPYRKQMEEQAQAQVTISNELISDMKKRREKG